MFSIGSKNLIFLAVTVLLLSLGQILVKTGLRSLPAGAELSSIKNLIYMFTRPYVILGICATGCSMFFYFSVLSHVNLSVAYPFISLSYGLVLILSSIFFDDKLTLLKISGIFLIFTGVFLTTR